jgi:hypothetical protein
MPVATESHFGKYCAVQHNFARTYRVLIVLSPFRLPWFVGFLGHFRYGLLRFCGSWLAMFAVYDADFVCVSTSATVSGGHGTDRK